MKQLVPLWEMLCSCCGGLVILSKIVYLMYAYYWK